jgi:hypothetical protein
MSKIAVVEPLVVNVSPKTNWTLSRKRVTVTQAGGSARSTGGALLTASLEMLSRDIVGATFEAAFGHPLFAAFARRSGDARREERAEQALTDVLAQQSGFLSTRRSGRASRCHSAYANINRGIDASEASRSGAAASLRGTQHQNRTVRWRDCGRRGVDPHR